MNKREVLQLRSDLSHLRDELVKLANEVGRLINKIKEKAEDDNNS